MVTIYIVMYIQNETTCKVEKEDKRTRKRGKREWTELKTSTKYYWLGNFYVMLSLKEKALLLNSKKQTKWANVSLLGFQYLLCLLHSWSMYLLVSIE